MDQSEIGKFVASYWQDIALAVIILVGVIGGVGYVRLAKHLERSEPSTWLALGRPKLFSKKSMKDELKYFGYLLTRKYRHSDVREIRMLGDLNFICLVVAWTLALAVMTFGDLHRYDHFFNLGNQTAMRR
jgi:hypothetical protein